MTKVKITQLKGRDHSFEAIGFIELPFKVGQPLNPTNVIIRLWETPKMGRSLKYKEARLGTITCIDEEKKTIETEEHTFSWEVLNAD